MWKQGLKEEREKEQRIQMTDKEKRQQWRSKGGTEREGRIPAFLLLLPLTTP